MPNTFTQLYIHIVFAVQNRDAVIKTEWEERLFQYITAIVQSKGHKMLVINGTSNHIHFFIGKKPNDSLSDLIREIKKSSTIFINDHKFCNNLFCWQNGYGAFSYSHSQIDTVVKYIMQQKEHHKKQNFKDEYIQFLKNFCIEYDDKYLFKWIEGQTQ